MSTHNYWTKSQVEFLHKLKAQCLEYSEFNRKQVNKYTTTNTHFNIPILVLSGLNSFVALGLQPFIRQEYISIINSILSLSCGILSSTALYMKYNEKINTCVACSHELNDLHATIFKELCLDEDSRSMDGKDFCNKMFGEYTKIMQKHIIPKKSIPLFLLTDKELQTLNNKLCVSQSKKPTTQNVISPKEDSIVFSSDNKNIDDNPDIENDKIQNVIEESPSYKKEFSLFGMFSTT